MKIVAECPNCGQLMRAEDTWQGREATCVKCQHRFRITASSAEERPAAVPPSEQPMQTPPTPPKPPPPPAPGQERREESIPHARSMTAKKAFAGGLYGSQALALLEGAAPHVSTISRQFMNEIHRLCADTVSMRELSISYRRVIGEKRFYIELRLRSAVTYMLFCPLGPSLYIACDTYCRAGCLHPLRYLRIILKGPNEFELHDLSMIVSACQQAVDAALYAVRDTVGASLTENVRGKWTVARAGSRGGFRRG